MNGIVCCCGKEAEKRSEVECIPGILLIYFICKMGQSRTWKKKKGDAIHDDG